MSLEKLVKDRTERDDAGVIVDGSLYQRQEADTANVRLPTDDSLVRGTSSAFEAGDRSRRLDEKSACRMANNWAQHRVNNGTPTSTG